MVKGFMLEKSDGTLKDVKKLNDMKIQLLTKEVKDLGLMHNTGSRTEVALNESVRKNFAVILGSEKEPDWEAGNALFDKILEIGNLKKSGELDTYFTSKFANLFGTLFTKRNIQDAVEGWTAYDFAITDAIMTEVCGNPYVKALENAWEEIKNDWKGKFDDPADVFGAVIKNAARLVFGAHPSLGTVWEMVKAAKNLLAGEHTELAEQIALDPDNVSGWSPENWKFNYITAETKGK